MTHVPVPDHEGSDFDLCPRQSGFMAGLTQPAAHRIKVVQAANEMVQMLWHRVDICNPFWRLYIVDRPGVGLIHDGREWPYPLDAVMLMPAWLPFTFLADDRVGHAFLHFTTPDLPGETVRRCFNQPAVLRHPELLTGMRRLAHDLLDHHHDAYALGSRALGLCQLGLAAAIEALPADQQAEVAGVDAARDRLAPALSLIRTRLDQPLAVADLAECLGVGTDQTIRLFKRLLGQTPTQVILEYRVERAASLLATNRQPLDQIAQRCGFPNHRYLNRVFSRRIGLTPSAYRARYQSAG